MFKISADPIDPAVQRSALNDVRAGACVSFEGWVRNRNDGRKVLALDYEAFRTLAEKEGARVLAEVCARWPVIDAICVHRVGALKLGDLAVWVGVTAVHRGAAFDACRQIIDEVKSRVPIWKKEHYAEGASEWINCATQGDFTEGAPPPAVDQAPT
jgi:molybdopterin synthase catalytic subunit